jgi:adenylylsulfate kinase
VREQRDPKGLYKKSRIGEVTNMTGISAPYEEPERPDLIIETDKLSLEEKNC